MRDKDVQHTPENDCVREAYVYFFSVFMASGRLFQPIRLLFIAVENEPKALTLLRE